MPLSGLPAASITLMRSRCWPAQVPFSSSPPEAALHHVEGGLVGWIAGSRGGGGLRLGRGRGGGNGGGLRLGGGGRSGYGRRCGGGGRGRNVGGDGQAVGGAAHGDQFAQHPGGAAGGGAQLQPVACGVARGDGGDLARRQATGQGVVGGGAAAQVDQLGGGGGDRGGGQAGCAGAGNGARGSGCARGGESACGGGCARGGDGACRGNCAG